jgi:K+-transporting ATPase KdpF subunit
MALDFRLGGAVALLLLGHLVYAPIRPERHRQLARPVLASESRAV